jgi:hypothetical protein
MTGTVSSPDAPDLTIVDPVRIVLHCRPFDDVGIVEHFPLAQWESSGTPVWFFGLRLAGLVLGKYDSAGVRGDVTTMNGAEQGAALHKNQDGWIGLEVERTAVSGVSSIDGVSWTTVRKTVVAAYTMRDGTSKLTIGTHGSKNFNGRIYLAKMEAIKRAQIVFPGESLNYIRSPIVYPTTGNEIEVIARVSAPWKQPTPDYSAAGILYMQSTMGMRRYNGGTGIQVYVYDPTSGAVTAGGANPVSWVDNQMVWLRFTATTTTTRLEWALDSIDIPTVWNLIANPARPTVQIRANTNYCEIGTDSVTNTIRPWVGRIARLIVRPTIGGAATLDMSENDAGVMKTATTFDPKVGATLTVNTKQPLAFMFPGTPGNYLSVPDSAALDIIGDLEVVARVSPRSWRRTPTGNDIVGKYEGNGNQRSWRFYVDQFGSLVATFSSDGISGNAAVSSSAISSSAGQIWVKFTRQAGVVKFYTAPDLLSEPVTWTQLGTDRTTTVTGNIFAGTSIVAIGGVTNGGAWMDGRVRRVIIRSGIAGTIVADINDYNPTGPGVSFFTATVGGTVSVIDTSLVSALVPFAVSGNVSTPDPGPLPLQVTFVYKIKGPLIGTTDFSIAGQWQTSGDYSWLCQRRGPGTAPIGSPILYLSTNGSTSSPILPPTIPISPSVDEWIALALDADTGTQRTLQVYTSTNGVTWTPNGALMTGPRYGTFDSASVLRVGSHGPTGATAYFNGNIYYVEARTGLDPAAGDVLWRFDASDYPGGGATSYVDPRGRTWTLTTAAVISAGHQPIVQLDPNVPTVNIVQPQPDSTIWEFNPNDYPRAGTVYTDPRGRVWTLTNASAIPSPPVVP